MVADKTHVDRVKQRVSVRVCDHSSPDTTPVIAFETDGSGIKRCLRRGQKMLAILSMITLIGCKMQLQRPCPLA